MVTSSELTKPTRLKTLIPSMPFKTLYSDRETGKYNINFAELVKTINTNTPELFKNFESNLQSFMQKLIITIPPNDEQNIELVTLSEKLEDKSPFGSSTTDTQPKLVGFRLIYLITIAENKYRRLKVDFIPKDGDIDVTITAFNQGFESLGGSRSFRYPFDEEIGSITLKLNNSQIDIREIASIAYKQI